MIGIMNHIPLGTRTHHQHHGITVGPVLKTMRDGFACFPPGSFTRLQQDFLILNQYKLTGNHIDEFILALMPVTKRRP